MSGSRISQVCTAAYQSCQSRLELSYWYRLLLLSVAGLTSALLLLSSAMQ